MSILLCHCGAKLKVRPSMAGVRIRCSKCGSELNVPSLSILQAYADRGKPVPPSTPDCAISPTPRQHDGVPKALFLHYCGEVGSQGRVSATALENFVGVVLQLVDEFANRVAQSTQFEFMVSCALMPQNARLIVIETAPANVENEAVGRLKAAMERTPAPRDRRRPSRLRDLNRPSGNLQILPRRDVHKTGPWAALLRHRSCQSICCATLRGV